jgi:hypothetical protein
MKWPLNRTAIYRSELESGFRYTWQYIVISQDYPSPRHVPGVLEQSQQLSENFPISSFVVRGSELGVF